MALNKTDLRTALETAFGADDTGEVGPSKPARDNILAMASTIADAMDAFVKSGTVTTTVTIPVTSPSPASSSGSGTGSVT